MPIPMQISDGVRIAKIDTVTNSIQVIDYEHHEIHSGSNYRIRAVELVTANTFHNITWKTGDTGKQLHMLTFLTTQKAAHAYIYEMPNAPTANGASLVPRNSNRNHPDASTAQFVHENSTLNLTEAIILGEAYIGELGTNPANPGIGGEKATRAEIILKQNHWYSIHIDEEEGDAQYMTILLDWYEHTPKTA